MKKTSNMSGGIFALAAIGVYVLVRNRESILSFFERQGIRLPHGGEIVDKIRTGANRVVNQVKSQSDDLKDKAGDSLQRAS